MDYDVPLPVVKLPKKDRLLPVKKEFEYNPVRSFREGNPYAMVFCYPHPLYHKPFIVKGGYKDCNLYLGGMDFPVFAHFVFFYKGTTRRLFKFYNVDEGIYLLDKRRGRNKTWELYHRNRSIPYENRKLLAEFKRVPRRWIRELNLYVTLERRTFHDVGSLQD